MQYVEPRHFEGGSEEQVQLGAVEEPSETPIEVPMEAPSADKTSEGPSLIAPEVIIGLEEDRNTFSKEDIDILPILVMAPPPKVGIGRGGKGEKHIGVNPSKPLTTQPCKRKMGRRFLPKSKRSRPNASSNNEENIN